MPLHKAKKGLEENTVLEKTRALDFIYEPITCKQLREEIPLRIKFGVMTNVTYRKYTCGVCYEEKGLSKNFTCEHIVCSRCASKSSLCPYCRRAERIPQSGIIMEEKPEQILTAQVRDMEMILKEDKKRIMGNTQKMANIKTIIALIMSRTSANYWAMHIHETNERFSG